MGSMETGGDDNAQTGRTEQSPEPDLLWVREEGWLNLKGTFRAMVALM